MIGGIGGFGQHEFDRHLAGAGILAGEVEHEQLLVRDELAGLGVETGAHRTRLLFFADRPCLIEGDTDLACGDHRRCAAQDIDFHQADVTLSLFVDGHHRHNDFLQSDAAVHIAAARAFQPQPVDGFGQQQLHVAGQPHVSRPKVLEAAGGMEPAAQHKASVGIGELGAGSLLAGKIAFVQRPVLVEEAVVCGDDHVVGVGVGQLLDDAEQLVQRLGDGVARPLLAVTPVAHGVDAVVVDIEDVGVAHQGAALLAVEGQQVVGAQGCPLAGERPVQDALAHFQTLEGGAVHDGDTLHADCQGRVGQECSHAQLREGGQHAQQRLDGGFIAIFLANRVQQLLAGLVAQGIRDDDGHLVARAHEGVDIGRIETRLGRDGRRLPAATCVHLLLPAVVERQQETVGVGVLYLLVQRAQQCVLAREARVIDELAVALIDAEPAVCILVYPLCKGVYGQPSRVHQIEQLSSQIDGGVGMLVLLEPMCPAALANDLSAVACCQGAIRHAACQVAQHLAIDLLEKVQVCQRAQIVCRQILLDPQHVGTLCGKLFKGGVVGDTVSPAFEEDECVAVEFGSPAKPECVAGLEEVEDKVTDARRRRSVAIGAFCLFPEESIQGTALQQLALFILVCCQLVQERFQDLVEARFGAGGHGHQFQLDLARGVVGLEQGLEASPASGRLKELGMGCDRRGELLAEAQLAQPQGHLVGAEDGVGEFHVQQPVVDGRRWRAGPVDQELLLRLSAQQAMLDAEFVVLQHDLLDAGQRQRVELAAQFARVVVPEDDAVAVEEVGEDLGEL